MSRAYATGACKIESNDYEGQNPDLIESISRVGLFDFTERYIFAKRSAAELRVALGCSRCPRDSPPTFGKLLRHSSTLQRVYAFHESYSGSSAIRAETRKRFGHPCPPLEPQRFCVIEVRTPNHAKPDKPRAFRERSIGRKHAFR